jgi:hypothetical protein
MARRTMPIVNPKVLGNLIEAVDTLRRVASMLGVDPDSDLLKLASDIELSVQALLTEYGSQILTTAEKLAPALGPPGPAKATRVAYGVARNIICSSCGDDCGPFCMRGKALYCEDCDAILENQAARLEAYFEGLKKNGN